MNRIISALVCGAIALVSFSCEKEKDVAVTSVSLSQPTAEMIIGENVQLTATVLPSDATDKTVTWASSKQSVATVSGSGKVTAVAEGVSIITASAGGKSATCTVTVSKKVIPVTSVDLNKTSMTLVKGTTEALVATVKPDDATDKTVTWSSSNPAIASVDSDGRVTGVAGGEVTIYAKAGGKEAKCVVTVIVPVASVSLNKESITLVEGESETLVATIQPDDVTDKAVSWSSSNDQIATVDGSGKVTAIKAGEATITAMAGDKTAACKIAVSKKVIAVSSIELNKNTLELKKGESETLEATVKPDDATDKTITWASSDSNVASVENGKVTAVGGGSAIITAKAGEVEAGCSVTVTVPVSSVALDKITLSLVEGEEFTLTASVKPDDATDKNVVWNSTNLSVATVAEGKVKALKEGTTTITAKAGEKTASCSVTVAKKVIAVESVSLNKETLTLIKGQSETLIATVKPDDATDKTVSWSTSDPGIATVDNNGKITAVAGGDVTIKANAGEKEATCAVSVIVPVISITLDQNSVTIEEGKTAILTATVNPEDASDKNVTWSTSDASVATVENGTVTAVKEGSATITAKAADKTAECKVTVSKKVIAVTSIELNKSSLELKKGDSETLSATVKPNDATDKTVSWSSSDASVASVDQNGKVTAVKSGTATITAKTGDKSANCSVIVYTPVESVSLDRTSVSLEEGQTTTLVATINPSDADEKTVAWSTSNSSVATVENGVITAIAEGEATISAKAGGKEATCKALVKKKEIAITSVTLNKTSLDLKKGESETLVATVKPDDATDKSITWSSSDVSVASVDQNGKVTALKSGKATITVKAENQSANCSVVVSTPVESVSLNETSISIEEGKSYTLVATINPSDADEQIVTWITSDDEVATVSNGVVTAVAEGACTITAIVGEKSAECKVTVTKYTPSGSHEGTGEENWD